MLNYKYKADQKTVVYAFNYCSYTKVLLEIVNKISNINRKDTYGNTVLLYAFEHCSNEKVLLEILKQKPDLNIQYYNNETAIMHAFKHCSNEKVLLEILKQKPDLNLQDKYDKTTAIMRAFKQFTNEKVLLEILKQKPDLNLQDKYNKTALYYAFKHYAKKPEFKFYVLEKLYYQSSCEDREKFNSKYIKLRNKHKIFPLILFRQSKKKSI